ncbi:Uncharacterised protein [Citrobacter freundii]|nr:Uncharacterised protein [Citrobacter freundii]
MSSIKPCSSFTLPVSPYRGPTYWRVMDNVSLRHVIRLILSVYWKERVSPACEPADPALSAGLEVASRAATALDLPRLEALKQCAHATARHLRRSTGTTLYRRCH